MRELERKVLRNCLRLIFVLTFFKLRYVCHFIINLWSGTVCLFMQTYPFVYISNVVLKIYFDNVFNPFASLKNEQKQTLF